MGEALRKVLRDFSQVKYLFHVKIQNALKVVPNTTTNLFKRCLHKKHKDDYATKFRKSRKQQLLVQFMADKIDSGAKSGMQS